jgi:hypothetical protein
LIGGSETDSTLSSSSSISFLRSLVVEFLILSRISSGFSSSKFLVKKLSCLTAGVITDGEGFYDFVLSFVSSSMLSSLRPSLIFYFSSEPIIRSYLSGFYSIGSSSISPSLSLLS